VRSAFRIPVSGWAKCVHEAAAFESKGEYATALILDGAAGIVWWLRNDQPLLRLPTPVGDFEPDFVYLRRERGVDTFGIIEVKGDIFWDGDGSNPRVKANAACRWVEAVLKSEGAPRWEFAVVLDVDAETVGSLEELRSVAVSRAPDAGGA
jgi:hypothetical protein